jgi:hypothetical protein
LFPARRDRVLDLVRSRCGHTERADAVPTQRRIAMPGRNKQRSTFEKRQREISRREKQAEKRARRQGKTQPEDEPMPDEEPLSAEEIFRRSLGEYPAETG